MAIKAVLFDYGGVLTEAGHRSSIRQAVAELFGIDIGWDQLDPLHDKLRRGVISNVEFFEELSKLHGKDEILTEQDWNAISKDVFVCSEIMYQLAADLRLAGLQTGILSNVYQVTADVLREVGNYDGFDPVILSCEVHISKPDKQIFDLAVSRLGCRYEEVLLLDDQEKNTHMAEELGMSAVLVDNHRAAVEEVRRRLQL